MKLDNIDVAYDLLKDRETLEQIYDWLEKLFDPDLEVHITITGKESGFTLEIGSDDENISSDVIREFGANLKNEIESSIERIDAELEEL